MFVLDASALIAHLFQEEGWASVSGCIRGGYFPSVNIAEFIKDLGIRGASRSEVVAILEIYQEAGLMLGTPLAEAAFLDMQFLKSLPQNVTMPDGKQSQNFSFADKWCLSCGYSKQVPIITADRPWRQLFNFNLRIICIRS